MTIHEQLKKELPEAMKARDAERLRAVRNLLAAFTNELVAKRMKPQEVLSDGLALAVIKRMANQRKDSIAQFREGGREDLVLSEENELAYLQKFLPKEASEEEIRAV
ncbi:MAG: GatB/YqeY domain-containing protein, partial [Patescibacteria group bacterium]